MKFITKMLVFCTLVFGICFFLPNTAYALNDELQAATAQKQLTTSGTTLTPQGAKKYQIWVGSKRITSANKNNVLGNGKVKYNPKTNTLTLRNAKITTAHIEKDSRNNAWYYGICSKQIKGLTLILKGKNTIKVPTKKAVACYGVGVQDGTGRQNNLLIKGSGSLRAQASKASVFNFGILCQNLNITENARVTACGGTMIKTSEKAHSSLTSYVGSCGVTATGFLALSDSAKLTATGKTRAMNKAATYSVNYTPHVKAGTSSKSIKVNTKKPASRVYFTYKYVSIANTKKATTSKKPAKMVITKAAPIGGGFIVTFNTFSKNCTGYQMQLTHVASGKSWTSNTTNIKKNTITITNLSGGVRYSVRIRAFNTIGSHTYYGTWSDTKLVTPYNGTPAG